MKIEHLNHHVIVGYWDDCIDNQVLIHYPPVGGFCTVFILSGIDYGGGIRSYSEKVPYKLVDALIEKYKDSRDSDYEFKSAINELVEAHSPIHKYD